MKNPNIIEPPDRPSIGLSIRKRNELNLNIQAQNDEAILAHDPALGTLTLQAYYAYSLEEVENLVANQRYCEDVGPFPCCLSTRIETARRMRRVGWYVRIDKGDVGSNACPIDIDADEEDKEDVKPKIEIQQSLDSQFPCKEALKVEVACPSFAADVVNIDSLEGSVSEGEETRVKFEGPLPELEQTARIDVKNEQNERNSDLLRSRWLSVGDADDLFGPEPIQGQSAIDDDDDDIDPNLIHLPSTTRSGIHEHQVSTIRPRPPESIGSASPSPLPSSSSKRRRSPSPIPSTRSLRARTKRKS
ncbi:hypothetical protein Moror_15190 [Moniliophthora roreri MCA 2997]|uniref:Uncharacterized protein n=2 Tax=Moniliophthora roreri TaxID=221103 RepID=V2X1U0_MONRO|nr:hypothetical protein Moror_15190 [Moniliophthora roreri MCA 2997]